MSRTPQFDVEIHVLPTELGGRRHGIYSGYRVQFWLPKVPGGSPGFYDAEITLTSAEVIEVGASGSGSVAPVAPDYWTHLQPGDIVQIFEGLRCVGAVTIRGLPGGVP